MSRAVESIDGGEKCVGIACSNVWNSLSAAIRRTDSHAACRRALNTSFNALISS